MAIVESAQHLFLFDDQDPTSRECGSGRRAERLTRHASCTQVVSTMENCQDRLLIPLRLNGDFDLPFLYIEDFLAGVAL